jgi:hypothetical protein
VGTLVPENVLPGSAPANGKEDLLNHHDPKYHRLTRSEQSAIGYVAPTDLKKI